MVVLSHLVRREPGSYVRAIRRICSVSHGKAPKLCYLNVRVFLFHVLLSIWRTILEAKGRHCYVFILLMDSYAESHDVVFQCEECYCNTLTYICEVEPICNVMALDRTWQIPDRQFQELKKKAVTLSCK